MAKEKNPDSRFASIQTDPRFQLPRKKSIRSEVDSRFKDALNSDARFSKKVNIDKYGRRIKQKDIKKELSRYYNFEDEEDPENSNDPRLDVEEASKSNDTSDEDSHSEDEVDSKKSDEKLKKPRSKADQGPKGSAKNKLHMRDLMRGASVAESSSSDDSSEDSESESDSDSESDDSVEIEDEYEQVRAAADAVPQGEETHRLAVVNLDWDNVNSTDLMATFSSFVPKNRRIVSVKIYPSEFGKKQMSLEELNGPAQELFPQSQKSATKAKAELKKKKADSDELDGDEDYSSSTLRKYQLQRLQYYYAVVECDSVATASEIYSSCDGTEYESTANFFDLRFIPNEVEFSQDKPRDECAKLPHNYQPTSFSTDALQHSKVKLTWDETPKERSRIAQKAFGKHDVEDEDLKAYLASDSESDGNGESIADRYRALIGVDASGTGANDDSGDDGDAVEITFNPVLEGQDAKLEVVGDASSNTADPESNLSTIERYKLKEKQRRLRRQENFKARKAAEAEAGSQQTKANQAELELLAMDDEYNGPSVADNTADKATNKKKLTKRATKKKALEEAEQDFDTADPRFQALYEDPDFAIDSTLPQFKPTKGIKRIIDERRKRQDADIQNENTRFGKFKRKQLDASPQDDIKSIKHLASKIRRKALE